MKVNINGSEVDYEPDFPVGWKFSAGDPFKFPVVVGGQQCFIKRFERKTPENISGWQLLDLLKQKKEDYLPRVFDIKDQGENDGVVHYLFYEYLAGSTLESAVAEKRPLDLGALTDHLFAAISSIHAYGFWFVDFCEKNIFYSADGRFVLIDLDSTAALNALPDADMYGSRDYWIPVFAFYKGILGRQEIALTDVSGSALNCLQIPFLILRLRNFYQGRFKYSDDEMYQGLPAMLNECSPTFSSLFASALEGGAASGSKELAEKLRVAVHDHLLKSPGTVQVSVSPVINAFDANRRNVQRGESLALAWRVTNADRIELYRNGALRHRLPPEKKQVAFREFTDPSDIQAIYQLKAFNKTTEVSSRAIIISKVEKPRRKRPVLWIIIAVLIILLLIILMSFV